MASFASMNIAITLVLVLVSFPDQIQGQYQFNKAKARRTSCNIYKGRWVFDDSYPLYNSSDCPFVENVFNCQKNGRPDNNYQKYRWQPVSCNLPRFNGGDFLRRFKGKKILFVGDSLSLNQWQSLTCMLHRSLPGAKYTLTRTDGLSTFTFPAYSVSIMLSRNALLVDNYKDKIGRILNLDKMENAQSWNGMDLLIFNSWHWWLHTGRQQPWDFIQVANRTYKDMDRLVAYEKAINTWATWVASNVDFNKTKVIFQGISPDHVNGQDWGEKAGRSCQGQQQPILRAKYPGGVHPAQRVVDRILAKTKSPIYLLNITNLSQLRRDGHPSVYGFGGRHASDCSHWCLAGVPDTWNELLYAALVQTF